MDALYDCGYTYIVDNIRGYKFTNYHYQTQYIKRLTPVIGKMVSSPELLPYLTANELLSDTDRDNILCECNNRGSYAGAVLLRDRITRKHGNWYMLFIKAFEEANCHEVAEKLRIQELMTNGRVKGDNDEYEEIGGGIGTHARGDYINACRVVEIKQQKSYGSTPVYCSVHTQLSEVPSIPNYQKPIVPLSVNGCGLEQHYDHKFGDTGEDITTENGEVSTITEANHEVRYKKEGYYIGTDRSIHLYMTTRAYDTVNGPSDVYEHQTPFALNTVNKWFAGFVELSLDQWD